MADIWDQFPDAQQEDAFAQFPDADPYAGQIQPGTGRNLALGAKTVGSIGANILAAPADMLALVGKGLLFAGDQTLGRAGTAITSQFDDQPGTDWSATNSQSVIPFAPFSEGIKSFGNEAARTVGLDSFADTKAVTPAEQAVTFGAEIAGSVLGGGGLAAVAKSGAKSSADEISALNRVFTEAYGKMIPGVRATVPEAVPVLGGKTIATPSIGDMTKPYAIAAERAAADPSKAALYLTAPHLADAAAGTAAGYVGGQLQDPNSPIPNWADPFAIAGAGFLGSSVASAAGGAGRGTSVALTDAAANPQGEFGGAKKSVVDQAARIMQGQAQLGGQAPAEAVNVIEAALAEQRAAGLNPLNTTGTLSNNNGLVSLEKGLRADPRYNASFMNADDAINQNYTNTLESQFGPTVPTDKQTAVDFVERDAATRRASAASDVASAEAAKLAADKEAAKLQSEMLATGTTPQGKASTTAGIDIATAEKQAREQNFEIPRQQRYDEAKAAGSQVQADSEDLAALGLELEKAVGPLVAPNSALSGVIGRLKRLVPEQVEGEAPKKPVAVNGQDLIELEKELSAAITENRANGALVARLEQARQGVTSELENLAETDPNFGQARQEAEDFFRQGAPVYRGDADRQTVAGQIRSSELSQSAPPLSQIPEQYFATREGAQNLKTILANDPKAQAKITEYLVQDMLDVVGKDGQISPAKIDAYLRNRADALAQFPAARKQIEAMRSRIVSATGKMTDLEIDLKAKRAVQEATEVDLNTGAARLFLGTTPDKAVDAILGGKNPKADMKAALQLLSKDPDGRAVEGFKQALLDRVYERTTNKSKLSSGDRSTSQSKTLSNLSGDQQAALAEVYSPEAMNAVRAVEKQIEILARKSRQATSGSSTVETGLNRQALEAMGKLSLRGALGNFKGGAASANIQLLADTIKVVPGLNDAAKQQAVRDLLAKSMQDPDLALKLLNRPVDPEKIPMWNRQLLNAVGIQTATREEGREERPPLEIDIYADPKKRPGPAVDLPTIEK